MDGSQRHLVLRAVDLPVPRIDRQHGVSAGYRCRRHCVSVNLTVSCGLVTHLLISMCLATIPAVIWVDNAGRKPILISGAFIMAGCHLIVAILTGIFHKTWPEHVGMSKSLHRHE